MRLRGKRPTLLLAGQSQTSSLAPPQSGRSEGSKHGDKAHMNRDFFPCSWVTAARTPVWQSYLVLTYSWRTDTPRLYPLRLCMDMVPKAKTSCRSGGVWYGCLLYPSRSGATGTPSLCGPLLGKRAVDQCGSSSSLGSSCFGRKMPYLPAGPPRNGAVDPIPQLGRLLFLLPLRMLGWPRRICRGLSSPQT